MAATTTMSDFTASVFGIGARTNSAGTAVADVTAEELRLVNNLLTEGAVTATAFAPAAGTGMQVVIGSGTAKSDTYVVAGEVSGQGNYLVRHDPATTTLTVPAADPAQARVDEVYVVVTDAPYDSGSLALPRFGYRKGDPGAGAPGPDTAWKASARICQVTVGAAVTSIVSGNITDTRVRATIQGYAGVLGVAQTTISTTVSDGTHTTIAGTDITVVVPASGQILCRFSGQQSNLSGSGIRRLTVELYDVTTSTIVVQWTALDATMQHQWSFAHVVDSLTPGSSKTYRWRVLVSEGTFTGGFYFGAVAEIHAA